MTDSQLYQAAIDFLTSFEGITQEVLQKHLRSEHSKPKDFRIVYRRLCKSAQNRGMSPKIISGSIGGIEPLGKVLFDFDPVLVAKSYGKSDNENLLDQIINSLNPTGKLRRTKRSIWPQYCQTIIHGAHFLSAFRDASDFYQWTNHFTADYRAKPALPLMISYEIKGFGFALACDFLKELGFSEYGKPDVHIKDIFKALWLIDSNDKSISLNYNTLKVIDRIAKENKTTPYAVDKVFWLIGSGNFYLSNLKIGNQKKTFIQRIKKMVQNAQSFK